MSVWEPLNENHAIAVMVAFVEFADPLPDRAVRRGLQRLEPVASELGFKGVSQSSRLRLTMSDDGLATQEEPIAGQLFTRRAQPEGDAGVVGPPLEQIALDAGTLVYRTWNYISWDWHFAQLKRIFQPIISLIADFVGVRSTGIEYLDRFRFVADGDMRIDTLLRRDSDRIASYIFDVPSLFHSHTGAYIACDGPGRKLQTVKVDAIDDEQGRWINLSTRQDHQFEASGESDVDPLTCLDQAHSDLKALLAKIITAQQAKRIYLQA